MIHFTSKFQSQLTDVLQILEKTAKIQPGKSPVKFRENCWKRPGDKKGGGIAMVIENGAFIDKGGVSVSVVHGELSARALLAMNSNHGGLKARIEKDDRERQLKGMGEAELKFFACGVSVVLHPTNPFQPTVHCNYRYCK